MAAEPNDDEVQVSTDAIIKGLLAAFDSAADAAFAAPVLDGFEVAIRSAPAN